MLKVIFQKVLTEPFAPGPLALISYSTFLVAWIFPRNIYSDYIHEPDLIFLDIPSFVLCTLSVMFFFIGLGFARRFYADRGRLLIRVKSPVPTAIFLFVPLIIAIAACATSCILIVHDFPNIPLLIWSQGGAQIKDLEQATGQHLPLGMANTWLLGILWWASLRYDSIGLSPRSRKVALLLIYIGMLLCIVDGVVQVSRMQVMLPVASSMVLYMIRRAQGTSTIVRRPVFQMLVLSASVVGLFILFSFIRGSDSSQFVQQLIGYIFSAYNRMAAVVNYRLSYTYAGRGLYLFSFIAFNHSLNAMVPIAHWMSWPTFIEWWQSEFVSVGAAGLNPDYIWSSAFGYIFADLGWLTPMWFLFYGLLAGFLWNQARKGKVVGVILYPWMAFCILFWFGMNLFLEDSQILVFVIEIAMLGMYERIFTMRSVLRAESRRLRPALAG